jgi:hypothetical protein
MTAVVLGYLDVYRLGSPEDPRTINLPPPVATLSLPLFGEPGDCRYFYADPPLPPCLEYLKKSWYQPNPKLYEMAESADHLCMVSCWLQFAAGWLCIPSSTIYEAVTKHVPSGPPGMIALPWELWGKRTSWIANAEAFQQPGARLASGLRTVAETRSQGPIIIWDFSTRAVEPGRRETESEYGTMSKVFYPIDVGLERDELSSWSLQIPRRAFFGQDESLANQPFSESKLHGREDSGNVIMEGEHGTCYDMPLSPRTNSSHLLVLRLVR